MMETQHVTSKPHHIMRGTNTTRNQQTSSNHDDHDVTRFDDYVLCFHHDVTRFSGYVLYFHQDVMRFADYVLCLFPS